MSRCIRLSVTTVTTSFFYYYFSLYRLFLASLFDEAFSFRLKGILDKGHPINPKNSMYRSSFLIKTPIPGDAIALGVTIEKTS